MRKLGVLVLVLVVAMVLVIPVSAQDRTITDIVVSDGRFDTLQAAVVAAGLADTLAGPGPFTVFAPTDTAFAAIDSDTLDALLADPGGRLTDILLYHVVPGEVPASVVVGLQSAATVQGSPIKIDVEDGGVVLDRTVNVIITNIRASNGIIHVIDAVLVPPLSLGNDLVLITGNANVEATSFGPETSNEVTPCQTFYVTDFANGALKLRDIPGWIDLRVTFALPADYGIPGGTPTLPQCEA